MSENFSTSSTAASSSAASSPVRCTDDSRVIVNYEFTCRIKREVCLTQQQAVMLLPLIQQIAAGSVGVQLQSQSSTPSRDASSSASCSNNSSPFFTPPPISVKPQATVSASGYSTDTSEASCKFSSDELFTSKRRNSKSSDAQFYACKLLSENIVHVFICLV